MLPQAREPPTRARRAVPGARGFFSPFAVPHSDHRVIQGVPSARIAYPLTRSNTYIHTPRGMTSGGSDGDDHQDEVAGIDPAAVNQIAAAVEAKVAAMYEERITQLTEQVRSLTEQVSPPHDETDENGIEIFIERYGTEMLIETMISLTPGLDADVPVARWFGKAALEGLFVNDERPTQHFHDLALAFQKYYQFVGEQFFHGWNKDLNEWKAFAAYHASNELEGPDRDGEKIREALRCFLDGEKVLLEWHQLDADGEWTKAEHLRPASDTLRNVLEDSKYVNVLMTRLPDAWFGDDEKQQKVTLSGSNGVKSNLNSILQPGGKQWDQLVRRIGETLIPPMNRVAVNAMLSYSDHRIDAARLYNPISKGSERDPLDEFVECLDSLRRDTRLSTDKGIHLGPDEEATGYDSHITRGPFFMNKLPRELRAYVRTKQWKNSDLGKENSEFGKDNLEVLRKVLRSTASHEHAGQFRGWRVNQARRYRMSYVDGRYIPVRETAAGKPKQLNIAGARAPAQREAALKALRAEFGQAFSENGEVQDSKPLKDLPRGKKDLDKLFEQSLTARVCQRCLSHPYYENKTLVSCPLLALSEDNETRAAWQQFSKGWQPARDRARKARASASH